jgi:hypothetical protein
MTLSSGSTTDRRLVTLRAMSTNLSTLTFPYDGVQAGSGVLRREGEEEERGVAGALCLCWYDASAPLPRAPAHPHRRRRRATLSTALKLRRRSAAAAAAVAAAVRARLTSLGASRAAHTAAPTRVWVSSREEDERGRVEPGPH